MSKNRSMDNVVLFSYYVFKVNFLILTGTTTTKKGLDLHSQYEILTGLKRMNGLLHILPCKRPTILPNKVYDKYATCQLHVHYNLYK